MITQEVAQKVDARPTKEIVNKSLAKLNQKMTSYVDEQDQKLNIKILQIYERLEKFDKELIQLNESYCLIEQKVENRLTKQDGQRLWKHFQRFCEYEDLKDLYSKVIPEIAKFEGKLMRFDETINQNQTIIRQFDEHLMNKCDKLALQQFDQYC